MRSGVFPCKNKIFSAPLVFLSPVFIHLFQTVNSPMEPISSCTSHTLSLDLQKTRFASAHKSKKRKGVVLTMKTREARTRFFFFLNSFALLLLCLFVTPTSAMAPHSKGTPSASAPAAVAKTATAPVPTAKKQTKMSIPQTQAKRDHIQVSRDDRRKVIRHGNVKISDRDMELLARLVYAEGRGEPYEGQVAIAAVVLNRVASSQFPNTVREVIFAPNAFSPVQNGRLSSRTNESVRKAVADAVNGKDPTNGSLYFFNPDTATSKWIWSRPQTVVIGNHRFAR
jgi:Cell wall hydrolyses involved in spore germination